MSNAGPGAPHVQPAPPARPSQKQAVWAFVLSLLGCCCIPAIVGIVMGFKVINRSEFESVDHGRGFGVAAVCIGFAQIGAVLLSIIFNTAFDTHALDTSHYVAGPTNADASIVQLFELKRRDCFDDSGMRRGKVGVLRTVDCDRAHDAEVIDVLPVASYRYPGKSAIGKSGAGCRASFADYVGVPLRGSELVVTFYYPTRASWAEPRSHAITCIVIDPPGKLEDSVWRTER